MDYSKLSNVMSMVKMASKLMPGMKAELESVERRLLDKRITGISGGGLCKITLDGTGKCVTADVDVSVLTKKQLADDLVRTAVNDAYAKLTVETDAERDALLKSTMGQLGGIASMLGGAAGGPFGAGAGGAGAGVGSPWSGNKGNGGKMQ